MSSTTINNTSVACKRRKNATAKEEIHKIPKIDIFFKDYSRRKTGDGGSGDKDESESENIDRTIIMPHCSHQIDQCSIHHCLAVRLLPPVPYI